MRKDKTEKDSLQPSWDLTLSEVPKLRTLDIKANGVVKERKESLTMITTEKCCPEAGVQTFL